MKKVFFPILALVLALGLNIPMAATSVAADGTLPHVNWLPPLSNQGDFQLKDGSTLPIKFTLTDPVTGAFVEDTGVKVDVNEVLFRDDFNDDNADGWTQVNYSGSGAVFAVENGEYSLDSTGGGVVAIAYPTSSSSWSNYITEVSVKKIAGTYWPDIFVRYQNLNNFYYVQMTSGGLLLRKRVGGIYSQITSWSGSLDLSVWHEVKIGVDGSSITVYLDGQQKITATDSSFGEGAAGVGAWDSHVHFDNFMVTALPATKTFLYGESDDNVRISYDTVFLDTFSAENGTQPDNPWQASNGDWEASEYIYEQTENVYIPGARSFAGDISWTNYAMTAKVKVSDDGWGGMLLRANTAADTYYELYLQRSGNLQLVKTVGGARTGVTNPYVGTFADQWWYVKAFVNGNNIKGKAWPVSEPEPSSWLINWTDAAAPITSGRIGLITFSWWESQLPVFFDDVSVQTPHYIANLHTKENGMVTGDYLITIWSGSGDELGTYLFDLTDAIQGKGRGKGKA